MEAHHESTELAELKALLTTTVHDAALADETVKALLAAGVGSISTLALLNEQDLTDVGVR